MRSLLVVLATSVIAAAPLTEGAATTARAPFAPVLTLADGACAGRLDAVAFAETEHPATAYVRVTPQLFGAGAISSECSVVAWLHWRNLDTGTSGAQWGRQTDTLIPPPLCEPELCGFSVFIVPTGSGRVALTLTTVQPHLPSSVEVVVP